MNSILMFVALWIQSTGMITPIELSYDILPEVIISDNQGLVDAIDRCVELYDEDVGDITLEEKLEYADTLNALYCRDQINIKYGKFNLHTPEGMTALVHEMVHWIQEHNGDLFSAPCVQATEKAAYDIHHTWQLINGLEPYPDRFTVMVRSTCPGAPMQYP